MTLFALADIWTDAALRRVARPLKNVEISLHGLLFCVAVISGVAPIYCVSFWGIGLYHLTVTRTDSELLEGNHFRKGTYLRLLELGDSKVMNA